VHRVTIHRLENAGGGRVPGRQHRTASMDKPPKDRMRPSGDELAAGPGRSTRSPGGIRKLHERVAVARVRPLSMSVSAKRPRTSPRMPPPGRDGDLPRRDSASGTNSANEGGGGRPRKSGWNIPGTRIFIATTATITFAKAGPFPERNAPSDQGRSRGLLDLKRLCWPRPSRCEEIFGKPGSANVY